MIRIFTIFVIVVSVSAIALLIYNIIDSPVHTSNCDTVKTSFTIRCEEKQAQVGREEFEQWERNNLPAVGE